MIHIKGAFKEVDVKIIQAKDKKALACDAMNFRCFNFKGKDIKIEGDDELSVYLFNKAIKQGAKGKPIEVKSNK